jgi:C4-type Zn-finger protein
MIIFQFIGYFISLIVSIFILVWFFRGMSAAWNLYHLINDTWICPNCGFRNNNNMLKCSRCNLDTADKKIKVTSATSDVSTKKLICNKCGYKNNGFTKICENCGNYIT